MDIDLEEIRLGGTEFLPGSYFGMSDVMATL